jgi:hypothetical protein
MRNAYNVLVGEPEGKTPLGKYRCRWKDNIRMSLREIGWEVVDWIHLAQVGTSGEPCEHDNKLSGSIKGGEFLD